MHAPQRPSFVIQKTVLLKQMKKKKKNWFYPQCVYVVEVHQSTTRWQVVQWTAECRATPAPLNGTDKSGDLDRGSNIVQSSPSLHSTALPLTVVLTGGRDGGRGLVKLMRERLND